MDAKKLKTEEELQDYCTSLSHKELKKFQLESKAEDIKRAKTTLGFFLFNIILCGISLYIAWDKKEIAIIVISSLILIVSILYSIGFSRRVKQEKIMYRMLEIWYNENKI